MIKNTLNIQQDWKRCKDAIAEHLLALAEHLSGLVNTYAPGVALKGSFEPYAAPLANDIYLEVGTPLEYGMYSEFGTRPHWAPIEPILNWAENSAQPHLLAVGVKFEGKSKAIPIRKGTIKLKGDARTRAIQNFAYAVQASIARRGTKEQLFFRRALSEMGLQSTIEFDSTGAHYNVDVVGYLQGRIDGIMMQSGLTR